MKQLSLLCLVLFVCRCTTTSTIDERIAGNRKVFDHLSAEDQQLVQSGQIRKGMSQNAVRIAWGKPDLFQGEDHGNETWIYTGGLPGGGPYLTGSWPDYAFPPYRAPLTTEDSGPSVQGRVGISGSDSPRSSSGNPDGRSSESCSILPSLI